MAEHKSEKSAAGITDGVAVLDANRLGEILQAHAHAMGVAMAEVISTKFAEMAGELKSERRRDLPEGDDAWLARGSAGEREHLKKLDHELHALEEALDGPQELLESEDGSIPPISRGEAVWDLPKYEPVGRDH